MWNLDELAAAVRDELASHARRRDDEHDVRGIDSLPELALHPIIHDAVRRIGMHVHPEVRYPSDLDRRRSVGRRCDLVVTREPHPIREAAAAEDLFAAHAIDPEDALWIEVKIAAQHHVVEGELRTNPAYASQLLAATAEDAAKLASDPRILAAGVLAILFTRDEIVAANDIRAWRNSAIGANVRLGAPWLYGFDMTDRHGSGRTTVALSPVHHY